MLTPRILDGCFEKHAGGNVVNVVYNRVEKLTRDKEMEIAAKKREFGKKFTSLHQTTIDILTPTKSQGSKSFFTGDIKGGLIAWNLDASRSLRNSKV